MNLNLESLKNELVPLAVEKFKSSIPGEATAKRSPIREYIFEYKDEKFKILEQNSRKIDQRTNDLTKFAKLSLLGNEVFWLIRERFNDWFLIVNGMPIDKRYVKNDGTILEGAQL